MDLVLMEHIVRHIYEGLGLLPAVYLDPFRTQSLATKDFKLHDKKLVFQDGDRVLHRPIYACQISLGGKDFKIMAGDCSQGDVPEFCVVIQLTDMPAYGMYLICDPTLDREALIAVSLDNQHWMPCSTFLQATLLAAMEQLKDVAIGWIKCTKYQNQYEQLLSMINFHISYYEVERAGQEDGS